MKRKSTFRQQYWVSRITTVVFIRIDTSNRPKSGIATGIIRGHLNKLDIGLIPINASWAVTTEGVPIQFRFDLNDVLPEHQACISALTELYTPILWYGAQEVS